MDGAVIDQCTQNSDTLEILKDRMAHIAQIWENLLFGSGGKLSEAKTFWYLIWWIWENDSSKLVTI
eukprot:7736600-Ditylum_brightwellii.AAC.1